MKTTISIQAKEVTSCLIPDITYSQVFNYHGKVPRSLKLHLVRPDCWGTLGEKLPTVIWIVGGAWRWTAPLRFAPELSYLAQSGFNVALIDYRVSSEAAFPAAVQDVKTAVRFLRAHAEKYGVDENRIAVMGDSAGGYLSAMLGTSRGIEAFESEEWAGYDSSVKAAIDFFGPTDLERMPKKTGNGGVTTPTAKFVGEENIQNEQVWKMANPINYISEDTPPFLIFHGMADEVVPYTQSELLYEALQKKKVPSDFYLLEGAGHAGFEFWQPEIKNIVLDFLTRYL